MQFETTLGEQVFNIELNEDQSTLNLNGNTISYQLQTDANGRILFRTGTKLYKIDNVSIDHQSIRFTLNGRTISATVKNEQDLLLEKLGFKTASALSLGVLNAPMPGKILDLLVKEGDEVESGQSVIILEAMKMENELKAPASGVIISIDVAKGDSVEKNQTLLEIEPRG